MAIKKWQGQRSDLEVSGGNLPSTPVGALQDVTITPDVDRQELRGTGVTSFIDVMETARAFDVTATVSAWDEETWDRSIEWDEVAGETDTSADVQRFDATVTFESSDGSVKTVVFTGGYFNPPPELSSDREGWVDLSINLRFPDVDDITYTDGSA